MSALDYGLRANLFLLLFYACYWLLLRHHTFFRLNRAYLLLTMVLSLGLPLAEVSPEVVQTMPVVVTQLPVLPVVAAPQPTVGPEDALLGLYGAGVLVMLTLLAISLVRLLQLIRRGERHVVDDYTLVVIDDGRLAPFSFFHYVVMNRTDYGRQAEPLLRHELVHVRQGHSVDVLAAELLKALCWFNPVAWAYKHSLQQVHEYLADEQAPNKADYARFLVDYAFNAPGDVSPGNVVARFDVSPTGVVRCDAPTRSDVSATGMPRSDVSATGVPATTLANPVVNTFVKASQLKARLRMLVRPGSRPLRLLRYVVVLPLALLLLAMTAAPERVQHLLESVPATTSAQLATTSAQLATTLPSAPAETPADVSTTTLAEQQTGKLTITGRVTGRDGRPMPGVNVVLVNTTRGTTTTADGRYQLTNVPPNSRLVFSFVGFERQWVPVKGRKTINVSMMQLLNELPELQVYGYGPVSSAAKNADNTVPVTKGPGDEEFFAVEQNPEFPGGMPALRGFLGKNIRYPDEARQKGLSGKVFIKFVVSPEGYIRNPTVLKGIGAGCDEEALRVVLIMPPWRPGRQHGRPVPVEYVLPIQFRYEGDEPAPTSRTGARTPGPGRIDSAVSRRTVTIAAPMLPGNPLVLIDNKEQPDGRAALAALHPDNIVVVNVLKGASATSQYGEKGRDGVILIQTKKPSKTN